MPESVQRRVDGIDLAATLRFPSLLINDPCVRMTPGSFERATLTPDGSAAVRVVWKDKVATAEAWGEGADWMLARIDGLLGLDDDIEGFAPDIPALRRVWERTQGTRICRTNTVWHDLAWYVLQQRVRFIDAADGWRSMVMALGESAPGPLELMVPPTPQRIASLTYDSFHPFGIEKSRAETLIRSAREMPRIEKRVDDDFETVRPRLHAIRGIGPWTIAGIEGLTWGSADAVLVGDVGLPSLVCWYLAREPWGDDDRMLELLEPYRPHRQRVIQLAYASGAKPPRRAPTPYGTQDIRRR